MDKRAKKQCTFWRIGCEGHTDALINTDGEDFALATVAAAEFWGVPWREVASRCFVKERRRALKGVCPRCGTFFYGGAELCDRCKRETQIQERELRSRIKRAYSTGKLL